MHCAKIIAHLLTYYTECTVYYIVVGLFSIFFWNNAFPFCKMSLIFQDAFRIMLHGAFVYRNRSKAFILYYGTKARQAYCTLLLLVPSPSFLFPWMNCLVKVVNPIPTSKKTCNPHPTLILYWTEKAKKRKFAKKGGFPP